VTRLDVALAGVHRLEFDSSPFIYMVEAVSRYYDVCDAVFKRIASGQIEGRTSLISLVETLVQPIAQNNQRLQDIYRSLLLDSQNLETVEIGRTAAEQAAVLRARYGLRTPDALQIAVALAEGCEAFLTNDRRLLRVTALRVLVLDELEV
jgi:predicted nucleic acid-binding protein